MRGSAMRQIDLRSEPSPGHARHARAMAAAEVGDDVYGEDPTVNRLEGLAAEMLARRRAVRAQRHAEQPARRDGPLRARR